MKACTFRNILLLEPNRTQNIHRSYMHLPCSLSFRRRSFVYVSEKHTPLIYILLSLLLLLVEVVVVVVVVVVVQVVAVVVVVVE